MLASATRDSLVSLVRPRSPDAADGEMAAALAQSFRLLVVVLTDLFRELPTPIRRQSSFLVVGLRALRR